MTASRPAPEPPASSGPSGQTDPHSGADLPDGSWPALHDAARWVGGWLFRPVFRLRCSGAERMPAHGPVVLVANHSSFVDGPLLFGLAGRRVVFLVKREMFTGVMGLLLPRIGQLAVRRGEPDRAPLLAAQRVLRAGGVVAVFPEGTRGEGDATSAHNGAAWLARSCDARVVAVACRGTRRPAGSRRRFRPPVDVLVGHPFTLDTTRGRAALAAATERVRAELAVLVDELDGSRGAGRLGTARRRRGARVRGER